MRGVDLLPELAGLAGLGETVGREVSPGEGFQDEPDIGVIRVDGARRWRSISPSWPRCTAARLTLQTNRGRGAAGLLGFAEESLSIQKPPLAAGGAGRQEPPVRILRAEPDVLFQVRECRGEIMALESFRSRTPLATSAMPVPGEDTRGGDAEGSEDEQGESPPTGQGESRTTAAKPRGCHFVANGVHGPTSGDARPSGLQSTTRYLNVLALFNLIRQAGAFGLGPLFIDLDDLGGNLPHDRDSRVSPVGSFDTMPPAAFSHEPFPTLGPNPDPGTGLTFTVTLHSPIGASLIS